MYYFAYSTPLVLVTRGNNPIMSSIFSYFNKVHPLSPPAEQQLRFWCDRKSLPRNTILQDVGKTCRTVYFVERGIARIFYFKEGMDITEYFAFEGDLIVRAESLFTGKPSPKGIEIIEDADIVAIPAQALFSLFDDFHEVERLFRLIFQQAYVETLKRIESLQFHNAKERYMALLEQKDYVNRIPLKFIASYLGITPVSLSRIRSELP
jgi:CRP-like cAMP-binding protein